MYEFKGRCIVNDRDVEDVKPITTTDIALSFLLSGPAAYSDRMEKFEYISIFNFIFRLYYFVLLEL
jgi:hypothetical protein